MFLDGNESKLGIRSHWHDTTQQLLLYDGITGLLLWKSLAWKNRAALLHLPPTSLSSRLALVPQVCGVWGGPAADLFPLLFGFRVCSAFGRNQARVAVIWLPKLSHNYSAKWLSSTTSIAEEITGGVSVPASWQHAQQTFRHWNRISPEETLLQ